MKEKKRSTGINSLRWKATVAILLIGVLVIGVVLLLLRTPLKLHYDQSTNELIISAGPFYTLEGHQEYVLSDDDILIYISASDSECRFHCIPGGTATQKLIISYSDIMGKYSEVVFEVERIGGLDLFRVTQKGGPISYQFLCSV